VAVVSFSGVLDVDTIIVSEKAKFDGSPFSPGFGFTRSMADGF